MMRMNMSEELLSGDMIEFRLLFVHTERLIFSA